MATATARDTRSTNRDTALRDLYDEVHAKSLFPFWATASDVEHDEIKQLTGVKGAVPHVWNYKNDLEPLLYRSAELVTTADSDRRSLILCNPGLAPKRATVSTLYTAYRLNDPNEVMPPHRHTPSAVRLGLTGKQNFTGVEGEDIVFGPGDLVLTPRDTWHNHGNVGGDPAVNLSVLDLPLVETLNALAFDHDYRENNETKRQQTARYTPNYSADIYGAGGLVPRFADKSRGERGGASPMYVYRYDAMRELLHKHRDHEGDGFEGLAIEYSDPMHGGPVYKTMTFYALMLRPGEKLMPVKQTASVLVSPFEGFGHCLIDGKRHDWAQFDTVAIPGGTWVEYVNGSDSEPAILFVASDEPAQNAFGLLQRFGRKPSGEMIRLA